MIRIGLCSGAFITSTVEELVAIAKEAALDAMEWAADAHIRPGDQKAAEGVMMATLRADMTLASYASLYRACSEDEGLGRFEALLKTASAMYAPNLRIFAPSKVAGKQDPEETQVAGELRRLGDKAAARGVTLCLSLGRNTRLDSYPAARSLMEKTAHPFVRLAWEDLPYAAARIATAELEKAGKDAALVIARCVDRDGRALGVEGQAAEWRQRIAAFKRSESDPKMGSFLLIGSAKDAGALAAETRALRALVEEIEASPKLS